MCIRDRLYYDQRGHGYKEDIRAVLGGLVAGRPAAATLLAARRAGAMELVWYAWRWDREPD